MWHLTATNSPLCTQATFLNFKSLHVSLVWHSLGLKIVKQIFKGRLRPKPAIFRQPFFSRFGPFEVVLQIFFSGKICSQNDSKWPKMWKNRSPKKSSVGTGFGRIRTAKTILTIFSCRESQTKLPCRFNVNQSSYLYRISSNSIKKGNCAFKQRKLSFY